MDKDKNLFLVVDLGEGMVEIEQFCRISGKREKMQMKVDRVKVTEWLMAPRQEREYVQKAFAHLNNGEREFLLSGTTPELWAATFGSADEDDFDETNEDL